ncbi:MAG: methylmalonyl-CoA mutase family protein [Acidimicrobiales bacterium]|jgi:methylmalonyl-CoA mutase N-terminal domain/subunit
MTLGHDSERVGGTPEIEPEAEQAKAHRVRRTDSGIEIASVYRAADLEDWDPDERLGDPGKAPYTRGIYPEMYRGRLWTMRQYAGFGTAEATNERFRFLLSAGQTGLSCAFDLPTQMGFDSDHPRVEGEVGKVGVAIDSLVDMRLLLADIPLAKVTTSMTINATAAILLLLYELVAEEQGVPPGAVKGTVQNDILKEYVARGTYVYPPRPSMRLVTDTFAYCAEHLKSWNTISISGYHIREAGSTAVQEIAFTMANGIAYVEAAVAAGLEVDTFAPRLSFFWNAHNHLFEEVAKYRAARRMWARIMTERFGVTDEHSKLLRFHTQTGGSTLTAQQPENNIVRVTLQALAAVLGGTQSLHTNGFDEALGLPTTRAAKIALRTQQVIGYESGVADTVDPLAGSYFVETLTDEMEKRAWEYIERIDELGGAVAAIEAGFMQDEIEHAAYAHAKAVDASEKVLVGVNRFVDDEVEVTDVFPVDPAHQRSQVERTRKVRATRDQTAVDSALADVGAAARGTQNLLVPMREALRRMATLGEVSDVLREVFGIYQPNR